MEAKRCYLSLTYVSFSAFCLSILKRMIDVKDSKNISKNKTVKNVSTDTKLIRLFLSVARKKQK